MPRLTIVGLREADPPRTVRAMDEPREQQLGTRPSAPGVLMLLLAALGLLATTPPPPSLEAYAVGEVLLNGSAPIQRTLHLHLDPVAGAPTDGDITLGFQSANGLDRSWSPDVSLTLEQDGARLPTSAGTSRYRVPVEQCTTGCDLDYQVVLTPTTSVLPGSIVRFEVNAHLNYRNAAWYGRRMGNLLSLDLEDAPTGPPAAAWSILFAVMAFAVGVAAAARVDKRLGRARRTWPAKGLLILVLAWIGRSVLASIGFLLRPGLLDELLRAPLNLVALVDPWSIGILGLLAWGLWRGIRRWPVDGGWSLSLAAVATIGLGGLWLVWGETYAALIHPIALALVFGVPAALGGLVLGQAWRTDPSSAQDRVWVAIAVLAHGILIAGFAFLALQSLNDPFGGGPGGLVTLVPALLVGLAFIRWLRGGRTFLVLFDLLIAGVGLLGTFAMRSLSPGYDRAPDRVDSSDVGIAIALVAALVALVTSFHRVRGPAAADVNPPPPAPPRTLPPASLAAGPPTT